MNAIYALLSILILLAGKNVRGELNPLVIKGYKFFDSVTGEYFPVKGIDYYPRPNEGDLNENNLDLFTDQYEHIWKRDVSYFKDMGINAIRLYAVDPNKSHDKFMDALSSAGIYAMIGMSANCENCEITSDPAPYCYPKLLKHRGQHIIKAFAKYSNVMAYSAGNEVNSGVGSPDAILCQKKFMRDMRAYISQCSNLRKVPIGAILADIGREEDALFYNCQTDASDQFENVEWYGLNSYVLCDGNATSMQDASGFQDLQASFQSYNYSVPVLLTEYGCINPSFRGDGEYEAQRTFLQSKWLYSKRFLKNFAGGFVFEYSTELANAKQSSPYPFKKYGAQNFGLGYFSPEDCDDRKIMCTYNPLPNYANLKKAYQSVDVSKELCLDEFTPEKFRTGRTECPKLPNFKQLASFKWKADTLENIPCSSSFANEIKLFLRSNIRKILFGLAFSAIAITLFATCQRFSHNPSGPSQNSNERSPLLSVRLMDRRGIDTF